MKALNTELLAKVSRSRAGGDAAGDSAALVQELKDILASSKVQELKGSLASSKATARVHTRMQAEEAPADEDPLAAPPSDAAALVVHASYLSAKIKVSRHTSMRPRCAKVRVKCPCATPHNPRSSLAV
eukprot:426088-Pelagomonas_calceolata.AAC.6